MWLMTTLSWDQIPFKHQLAELSTVPRSLQDSTKLHSIHIMVKKEGDVMAGLLKLLAMYYVFHLTYLKTHGMVLGFCKLFDG